MESNLVSYIIPIWEKSSVEELESSINSLIPEDPLIEEILIVFDGYKSFNKKIIFPKKFFKKLKFIYCGINNGPGIARNKGVLFSKSKYILFLDCGDQSVPKRAKIQIKSLNENDVSFGNIREISPSGKESIRKGSSTYLRAKRLIGFRNPFNNVTMAIKKKSFFDLGGYANLRIAEDWVLIGKILKKQLKISILDVELVKVFTGQDFIIRRHGKKYFEEINKCLVILLELKLINKLIYCISFLILFITRSFLPKKILFLIYRFLRK